jgi:hypothetical protein
VSSTPQLALTHHDGRSMEEASRSNRDATQPTPHLPAEPLGGWVSPDGLVWHCPDTEHVRTADRIIAELRIPPDEIGGAQWALERLGWLHITDLGKVLSLGQPFTQPQLDYLFDLAQAHPLMRESLMAALETNRRETL